jgi:hypothetical protein
VIVIATIVALVVFAWGTLLALVIGMLHVATRRSAPRPCTANTVSSDRHDEIRTTTGAHPLAA